MTTTKARKASALSPSVWGIVLAGGRASQFGSDIDPVFLSLGSKPVLTYCLSAIERCPDIEGIVVVAPKERVDSVRTMIGMFGCTKVKAIVAAPPAREASVSAGLQALADRNPGYVAILDGAIPGVAPEMISEAVKTSRKHGIAAVARPVGAPVCESAKGTKVTGMPEDGTIWVLLGPQVFRRDHLEKALANAAKKKIRGADEAALAVAAKLDVHLVPIRRLLIRIDSPQDLNLADHLLRH
jgi:2-C-methyl-D-erythritol 4-phosphate cytidylyltransferase